MQVFQPCASVCLTCTNLSAELSWPASFSPERSDNSLLYSQVCLLLLARANRFEGEHLNMVDTANVQSELMAHIQELHKKRGKLEADIIAVDSLNKERIAISAAREIDAYRHLQNLHSTRRL
jgi:hypothetical protein